MNVEIETTDQRVIFDIFGKNSASVGDVIEIPGNAKVAYQGTEFQKVLGASSVIRLAITFATDVASELVANWLYDKIKGKSSKLRIERTEVQIDQGKIARIIEEKMTTK